MKIEKLLLERGKIYGDFKYCSEAVIYLYTQFQGHKRTVLEQHEIAVALFMISNKLARIICGDPSHKDSWVDLIGYIILLRDCKKTYKITRGHLFTTFLYENQIFPRFKKAHPELSLQVSVIIGCIHDMDYDKAILKIERVINEL
jgi:hypothetical protein